MPLRHPPSIAWVTFVLFVLSAFTCLAQPLPPPTHPANTFGPRHSIPRVDKGRIDAIATLGGGVVICATRSPTPGHIFRSTDDGLTWTDLGKISQHGFTCVAAGQGASSYALTDQSDFWISRDRGQTWKLATTLSDGAHTERKALSYGIWLTEKGTLLVSDTHNSGGRVYRSTDEGVTWSRIEGISTKGLYRFNRTDDGVTVNGWAGAVYLSRDDGLTWKATPLCDNPLYATEYLGNGLALQASEKGVVYRGTQNGADWQPVGTPGDAADDFASLGSGVVLYCTYTGARNMYLSTDDGLTWQSIGSTGTVKDDNLDHVIAIPKCDEVIVIGGTRKGFILRASVKKSMLKTGK
jgi:photosystem II stability/assembly factor-like uncharacterized protein